MQRMTPIKTKYASNAQLTIIGQRQFKVLGLLTGSYLENRLAAYAVAGKARAMTKAMHS